jgi:SAM-dependent methyltransferase
MFNLIKLIHTKGTIWTKLFLTLLGLLIIIYLINLNKDVKEGLSFQKSFTEKTGDNIYDDFYVSIYDDLFYSETKNTFEENQIIKFTTPTKNSNILDVGSGTGHHVNDFTNKGYKICGIDKSNEMVKYSREKYPSINVKQGDVLNSIQYSQNTFTHILCLYFTIYYINDKRTFFSNCSLWLRPGGYLVLHLVNRDTFDAVVPAGETSNSSNSSQRQTNTNIAFNDFTYKAQFNPRSDVLNNNSKQNNNITIFKETIKDKNGSIRQNTHKLFMPTQREILNMAKDSGFIVLEKINLSDCNYGDQYIYVLQKPN